MKTLTVHPAWAYAFVHLGKSIENRTWRPSLKPGERFAIHAGQMQPIMKTRQECEWMRARGLMSGYPFDELEIISGHVVAIAEFVEVVETSPSVWWIGPYGWAVRDVRPLSTPIPCRGALGLWELPAAVRDVAMGQVDLGVGRAVR